MRTIEWNPEINAVRIIDQTLLPAEYKVIDCTTLEELAGAIRMLKVRGAPALGAAGAYGIALAAHTYDGKNMDGLVSHLNASADVLRSIRPTAVNLFYGINRTLKKALHGSSVDDVRSLALSEAEKLADEDVQLNRRIGDAGAELLNDGDTIMTHCNAGRLACVDWGTALGVVRSAVAQGKKINVIACETRPLNQGGRIPTWELMEDKIPVKLIADNMSAHVMSRGMVDCMIVGADRITRDAVFNKIGTHTHAVVAARYGVPFYAAAPVSTFDLEHTASEITIEERDGDELRFMKDMQIAPRGVEVFNPAFDITPLELVSAIITEKGILRAPYEESFKEYFGVRVGFSPP